MSIVRKMRKKFGNTIDTDSYKLSHFPQYPKGTTAMMSYIESRGGMFTETMFFGLQFILKEYFGDRVTMKQVKKMRKFAEAHGEPFNYKGWKRIVKEYNGYIPIKIRAVPEGTVVPVGNVLCTIETTVDDPDVFWAVSYFETKLLRMWYPITVATLSREMKKLIWASLVKTSDAPDIQIPFKLHDFGSRGVSSMESAMIGGMSHLVNFMGSDTLVGVACANLAYNIPMSGFSIPAAEHSTMTMKGRAGETEQFRTMLKAYAKPGAILAVVSDGYDYWNALRVWGTELKQEVIDSGATVVIRPDSGYPPEVVRKSLEILDGYYGSEMNNKGYKVLNNVRVIQGDGITFEMTKNIIAEVEASGYSMDNLALGMGGGLLQHVDRDTQEFAMKCCAAKIDGEWIDVYKNPITSKAKVSKKGRMTLIQNIETKEYSTVRINELGGFILSDAANDTQMHNEVIQDVWDTGDFITQIDFETVRVNAALPIAA